MGLPPSDSVVVDVASVSGEDVVRIGVALPDSVVRPVRWPQARSGIIEYEAGLGRRGDVTVRFSEDAIEAWRDPPNGKPGGQRTYAGTAIEAALMIRMVFRLPLRTEGFL